MFICTWLTCSPHAHIGIGVPCLASCALPPCTQACHAMCPGLMYVTPPHARMQVCAVLLKTWRPAVKAHPCSLLLPPLLLLAACWTAGLVAVLEVASSSADSAKVIAIIIINKLIMLLIYRFAGQF